MGSRRLLLRSTMGDIQWLADTITCHAWNGDRTRVALCPNTNEVRIYKKDGANLVLESTLTEHDKLVTGIDWAPQTNRIVTCGQDRNAYVWTFENNEWKPMLVILRINRAATSVKWSPLENKFAVGSGSKCVSICYFEEDNNWWVSKHIKKHKSTVLELDWHPNNVLLATASSDFRCRVFSTFIKGVDQKPPPNPFGEKFPFAALLAEYSGSGWIHDVSWSNSGNQLCFVSHDSTATFIDASAGAPGEAQVIRVKELPFITCNFVNETTAIAAGYTPHPVRFVNNNGTWEYAGSLDEKKGPAQKQQSGSRAAFTMFQNKVETGQDKGVAKLDTRHQNTILQIRGWQGAGMGNFTSISTIGADGRLVFWKQL